MEHFKTGNNGTNGLVDKANDFCRIANVCNAALYTTGSNGATAGNREYVFHGKKEGLIGITLRGRNIFVDNVHKLKDALAFGSCKNFSIGCAGSSFFKRLESGTSDDGRSVAREAVLVEHVSYFHFNELEKFGVVHLVALVKEYYDVRNAYLTSEQDVLTGLGHGTVGSCNYEDSAVHLSGTGNHVLNVVGMSRAVNVRIVALVGLIFNVCGVYCYTARLFFGCLIDFVVSHLLSLTFARHYHSDSCGQSGLAVVNVADSANVNVGLAVVVLSLCHFCFLL